MKIITKRFLPGQDLRKEIEKLVQAYKIHAGVILSIVGSLRQAKFRMVGGKIIRTWKRPSEIVSATGTLSLDGCHVHMSIADVTGKVVGGHLKEGCILKTTAEVVIAKFPGLKYRRKFDRRTGYDELVVE